MVIDEGSFQVKIKWDTQEGLQKQSGFEPDYVVEKRYNSYLDICHAIDALVKSDVFPKPVRNIEQEDSWNVVNDDGLFSGLYFKHKDEAKFIDGLIRHIIVTRGGVVLA